MQLICSCRGMQACHPRPYFSTFCRLWQFIYSGLLKKKKKNKFLWEQSCLLCVRQPVCLSACVVNEMSSPHAILAFDSYPYIQLFIHPSSHPSICVSYLMLPRQHHNLQQTGVLSPRYPIPGDPHCSWPPRKCSPAVRGHTKLHIHLQHLAKATFHLPEGESVESRILEHPPQVYYSESYPGFHPCVENVM